MDAAARILKAAAEGDAEAVRLLLREDLALVLVSDQYRKTPLHWAAERDHDEVARLLLDTGAELEATTSWGATAFDWAASMGSTRVAELLLARGAQGMTLVAAAGLGKLELVQRYLEGNLAAEPRARRALPSAPDDHWPPDAACLLGDVISDAFHSACRNGHTAVAEFLLARGADVNAKGVFGGTALHWAAIQGHRDTVAFLLRRGADRTIRDARFGTEPQDWAEEGKHWEIREMLGPKR